MKIIYSTLLVILACTPFFISCVSREYAVTENYQETQYKTEYTTEVYTDNESTVRSVSGEYTLPCYYRWHSTNSSYYGYQIEKDPYYDNIHLRISFWPQLQNEPATMRVFDMSKTGHLPSPDPLPEGESETQTPQGYIIFGSASESWLKSANAMISQAKFLGGSNYVWSKLENPNVIVLDAGKATSIAIIFTDLENRWNGRVTVDVLWTQDSIEYHQVTKERQVSSDVPYQLQKQRTVYKVKQVPIWESIFAGE